LCIGSLACQDISADNPFDPSAPTVLHAPGSIVGEILTSETSGDLEGSVVYLVGTSLTSVLTCINETEGQTSCRRGRFNFNDLEPGTYEISLNSPCYSTRPFATIVVDIGEEVDLRQDGAEAIIVKFARGVVSGKIDGPSSEEMTRVQVSDGLGTITFPNPEGLFRLEMASCLGEVTARLSGYYPVSSEELNVPIGDELLLDEPLRLELIPIPAQIVGRLSTEEEALPEEGVNLILQSTRANQTPSFFEQVIRGEEILIEEIPSGRWQLTITHPMYQEIQREITLLAAPRGRDDAYDLGTVQLIRAVGSLSGQVNLESSGLDSQIYVELAEGPSAGLIQQTNDEGIYIFPLIIGGEYKVEAKAVGYLSQQTDESIIVTNAQESQAPPIQLLINPGRLIGAVKLPDTLQAESITLSLGSEVTQSQNNQACEEDNTCLPNARCEGEGDRRICLQPFGFFQFEGMVAGEYHLEVRPTDNPRLSSLNVSSVRIYSGETTTLTGLSMERAYGSIQGQVRLSDIETTDPKIIDELSQVQMILLTESGQSQSLSLDPQSGHFNQENIAVGTHSLLLSHPDYLSVELSVDLASEESVVNLGQPSLEINPGIIQGTVLDEDALPIINASVLLGDRLTETNEQGLFSFSNLRADRYSLLISASGYQSITNESIEVNAGESRILNTTILTYTTGALQGIVTLEENTQFANVLIRAEHIASGEENLTFSNVDGTWSFASLRTGIYEVTISALNYETQRQEVELEPEITRNLEVELFFDRGCIEGTISLGDGSEAYNDVSITLMETVSVTQADEQGRFQFDQLIPGTYTIQASLEGYRDATNVVNIEPGLACGEVIAHLTLDDLQTPAKPELTLSAAMSYTPLGSTPASPAILAIDWDEQGRAPITITLDERYDSPLDDYNFDPSQGLGRWMMRVNGGQHFELPLFSSVDELFYFEQTDDSPYFTIKLPIFNPRIAMALSKSAFIQQLLGLSENGLELLSDLVIIERVNQMVGEPGTADRISALQSINQLAFAIELIAEDSVGNRSDYAEFRLLIDTNSPEIGAIEVPSECYVNSSTSSQFENCYTNRETLSLNVQGVSTDLVCMYLVEFNTSETEIDFTPLFEEGLDGNLGVSLVDDCLPPGVSQLISTNDQAEGQRTYCLFGVDASGRVALPRGGNISDSCLTIIRDITAPSSFVVYPNQAIVRGSQTNLRLIVQTTDDSLSHYEIRNVTRGTEYERINLGEENVFVTPRLNVGQENLIQVRAVDIAGNTSEPVNVTLYEETIKTLNPEMTTATLELSSIGDQTVMVNAGTCVLTLSNGQTGLGGRGCQAKVSMKDEFSTSPTELILPKTHQRLSETEPHTFERPPAEGNPMPIFISAQGQLERLHMIAELSDFDPSEVELYLYSSTGDIILLNHAIENDLIFETITRQNGSQLVKMDLDSNMLPRMQDAIEGLSSYGLWRINFVYLSPVANEITLNRLDMNVYTDGEELTSCIVACRNESEAHTGKGHENFQVDLKAHGLMFTQYLEHSSGKSHQARYWSNGLDGHIGTDDDYQIVLNDNTENKALPIIAISNGNEYVATARALESVSSAPGEEASPPGFILNSYHLNSALESLSKPFTELSSGDTVYETLRSETYEEATLLSMKMFDDRLWFRYKDLTQSPAEERLSLWDLSNNQTNVIENIEFSPPYENARPLMVLESNQTLLLMLETENGETLLKQIPSVDRLIENDPADQCDCSSTQNSICYQGYCYEFASNRTFSFDCSTEQEQSNCQASLCGENMSVSASGKQLIFQQKIENEDGQQYALYKAQLNMNFCNENPKSSLIYSEPLESVEFHQGRLQFLSNQQSDQSVYELDSSKLTIIGLDEDDDRGLLQAGNKIFVETRTDGVYVSLKDFGGRSIPLSLPETLVNIDGSDQAFEVSVLENNRSAYKLLTIDRKDYLYLFIKGNVDQRTKLIRALIQPNTFGEPLAWTQIFEVEGEINDFKGLVFNQVAHFMIGINNFNGPRFIFDRLSGQETWSYQTVGIPDNQRPSAPCKRVAFNTLIYNSNLFSYLCAMQEQNQELSLHLGELNLQSVETTPTPNNFSIGSNQYLNARFQEAFDLDVEENLEALLTVYKLKNIAMNPLGGILIELSDDDIGRLYYGARVLLSPAFAGTNPQRTYQSFIPIYARLGLDPSPPIFESDSIIFTDELATQEPEIVRLSLDDFSLIRLSANGSPQYSPTTDGQKFYWFDERYVNTDGNRIGTSITRLIP
jgi:hypothetical protein